MSTTVHLNDPQALYEHWEQQQWSPWEIDLAADQADWRDRLGDEDKALVYWALSSLMVAEERITTKFAGLVMAGDSEEETTSPPSRSTRLATCSSTPASRTRWWPPRS
jgi:ribonucleotide reductase beta subunit family protein with ferritin-like domain